MINSDKIAGRRRHAAGVLLPLPLALLLTLAPVGAATAHAEPPAPVGAEEPTNTAADLTALATTAAAAANAAQQRLIEDYPSVLALGLDAGSQPVTPWASRGERALSWALDQIGKPYIWGAQGPDAFDCSGLTSQAWHVAGVDIPRTSQDQWSELPKVTDGDLRPGDLVVYFKGASHVALYAGNGLIVQAPRSGRTVSLSPLGAMPVLGVVRPS
ncbi:C40 family peptidase [Kitasatospora azatica]|uniref:C40 family peptidase n=1 Tax=Kitasatospora azatica TaxID=58347 RepID=UPI00068A8A9B